jgi:hypothetical protein
MVTGSQDYYPLVLCARRGMVSQSLKRNARTKVEHSIERRTSRRFQIVLPVLFRWADSVEHYDNGHSGNAGQGGMFILAAKCPPPGAEVAVEFALPAFDLVRHPVRLRCIGRVSRVEACLGLNGFAVAGHIVNETLDETLDETSTKGVTAG